MPSQRHLTIIGNFNCKRQTSAVAPGQRALKGALSQKNILQLQATLIYREELLSFNCCYTSLLALFPNLILHWFNLCVEKSFIQPIQGFEKSLEDDRLCLWLRCIGACVQGFHTESGTNSVFWLLGCCFESFLQRSGSWGNLLPQTARETQYTTHNCYCYFGALMTSFLMRDFFWQDFQTPLTNTHTLFQ